MTCCELMVMAGVRGCWQVAMEDFGGSVLGYACLYRLKMMVSLMVEPGAVALIGASFGVVTLR